MVLDPDVHTLTPLSLEECCKKGKFIKVENVKVKQTSKMGKFCFAILDIVLMEFYEKGSKSKKK